MALKMCWKTHCEVTDREGRQTPRQEVIQKGANVINDVFSKKQIHLFLKSTVKKFRLNTLFQILAHSWHTPNVPIHSIGAVHTECFWIRVTCFNLRNFYALKTTVQISFHNCGNQSYPPRLYHSFWKLGMRWGKLYTQRLLANALNQLT